MKKLNDSRNEFVFHPMSCSMIVEWSLAVELEQLREAALLRKCLCGSDNSMPVGCWGSIYNRSKHTHTHIQQFHGIQSAVCRNIIRVKSHTINSIPTTLIPNVNHRSYRRWEALINSGTPRTKHLPRVFEK